MINNERKKHLIDCANKVISNSSIVSNDNTINASYNRHLAAFPVSVAMIGLIPTIRYYNNPDSESNVDKRKILEMIDAMYFEDTNPHSPNTQPDHISNLFRWVNPSSDVVINRINEYAIALKQVIRTYKLIKDE